MKSFILHSFVNQTANLAAFMFVVPLPCWLKKILVRFVLLTSTIIQYAGVCTLTMTNPIWVVKTRMILQTTNNGGMIVSGPVYGGLLGSMHY